MRARADRFKAQPVEGCRAVLLDGHAVLGSRIAFMRGQAVGGENLIPNPHTRIASHFRKDGRSGNGMAARIAFNQRPLGNGDLERHGIDQDKIGRGSKLRHGHTHG
jgi:hypothetical protein